MHFRLYGGPRDNLRTVDIIYLGYIFLNHEFVPTQCTTIYNDSVWHVGMYVCESVFQEVQVSTT